MLRNDYDRNDSDEKNAGRESEAACRQDWLAVNRQS
jgi:hypothetical protein